MKSRIKGLWVGLGLLTWCAAPLFAGAPEVAAQPSVMIVGDVFQFIPGAWAEYHLLDHAKEEEYTMRIALLDSVRVRPRLFARRQKYQWMEIDVALPEQPRVTIQCLVQVTPEGPGDMHEALVQIEGFRNPLRLKRRRLRTRGADFVNPDITWSEQRLEERTITHQERSFQAWTVEASDDEGRTIEATVSADLPPIGVYHIESPAVRMTLNDWGMGATGTIHGKPLGLWRWIFRQVRGGLSEPDSASGPEA